MNHLYRELAPVPEAAWEQIEDEAKGRLVTYLAARKLVDLSGPHGWDDLPPTSGVWTRSRVPGGRAPVASRRVLPRWSCAPSSPFSREGVDDAADRGADDIELPELDEGRSVSWRRPRTSPSSRLMPPPASWASPSAAGSADRLRRGTWEQYPKVVAHDNRRAPPRPGSPDPMGSPSAKRSTPASSRPTSTGGHLLLDHLRKILGGPPGAGARRPGRRRVERLAGTSSSTAGKDLSIGYSGA